ncbi:unnamed protein product [Amoebophrya sp. A25]|nr:unnamed protein product [Amoebophrya sp. A25]|eukprot:GSA25T00010549001.1
MIKHEQEAFEDRSLAGETNEVLVWSSTEANVGNHETAESKLLPANHSPVGVTSSRSCSSIYSRGSRGSASASSTESTTPKKRVSWSDSMEVFDIVCPTDAHGRIRRKLQQVFVVCGPSDSDEDAETTARRGPETTQQAWKTWAQRFCRRSSYRGKRSSTEQWTKKGKNIKGVDEKRVTGRSVPIGWHVMADTEPDADLEESSGAGDDTAADLEEQEMGESGTGESSNRESEQEEAEGRILRGPLHSADSASGRKLRAILDFLGEVDRRPRCRETKATSQDEHFSSSRRHKHNVEQNEKLVDDRERRAPSLRRGRSVEGTTAARESQSSGSSSERTQRRNKFVSESLADSICCALETETRGNGGCNSPIQCNLPYGCSCCCSISITREEGEEEALRFASPNDSTSAGNFYSGNTRKNATTSVNRASSTGASSSLGRSASRSARTPCSGVQVVLPMCNSTDVQGTTTSHLCSVVTSTSTEEQSNPRQARALIASEVFLPSSCTCSNTTHEVEADLELNHHLVDDGMMVPAAYQQNINNADLWSDAPELFLRRRSSPSTSSTRTSSKDRKSSGASSSSAHRRGSSSDSSPSLRFNHDNHLDNKTKSGSRWQVDGGDTTSIPIIEGRSFFTSQQEDQSGWMASWISSWMQLSPPSCCTTVHFPRDRYHRLASLRSPVKIEAPEASDSSMPAFV